MKVRIKRLVGLVAVLALVLAACSGDGDATTTTAAEDEPTTTVAAEPNTTAEPVDGELSGSIVVSGSSTVEPITARVGEAFDGANPGVATSVEGPGTGDGFARFCNGETDISDASRPISDEEIATCEAAGVEYVELHIATDGLTVMTNPANDAVSCLAFTDLYALLGPESEGFANWSDANGLAGELSAPNAPYSDDALVIYGPGEESGTYDTFVEFVIADISEERLGEDNDFTRADYNASANDNVIVEGITENPTSLGWVGFAFFEENADVLKAIELDNGESGCVAPTVETIASFEYPLSRPLFIYVTTNDLATRADLTAFVDYYLSDEGLAFVSDAGYVQLPAEDIETTRAAWEGAKG
ncbi:MAG: phosphate ABC transporter substrate-binding protein PstS family protein [Actinomycetota bacterium]|nr:phosphate ABC transporter substrate-binding protein PstS family protein [Actinomycetota bacterium]